MTIDAIAALGPTGPGGMFGPGAPASLGAPGYKPQTPPNAGSAFSLSDVARFENAMSPGGISATANATPAHAATQSTAGGGLSPAAAAANTESVRALFGPLDRINGSTDRMMAQSHQMLAESDLRPGEMIKMMASVQQFMLECQLTSSVANRTSDGIQELFRQQS
jgi:hypothetical protein